MTQYINTIAENRITQLERQVKDLYKRTEDLIDLVEQGQKDLILVTKTMVTKISEIKV